MFISTCLSVFYAISRESAEYIIILYLLYYVYLYSYTPGLLWNGYFEIEIDNPVLVFSFYDAIEAISLHDSLRAENCFNLAALSKLVILFFLPSLNDFHTVPVMKSYLDSSFSIIICFYFLDHFF